MKTIFSHIEKARMHPHHVRKQIAFVVAGAGAGLIAFMWVGLSLATDSFALKGPTSFGQGGPFAVGATATGSQLASAGAALESGEDVRPRIEVVDAVAKMSPAEVEKTFIPF